MPPGSSPVGGGRLALLRPTRYTRATQQEPGRGHRAAQWTAPVHAWGTGSSVVTDGSFGQKCLVLLSAEWIFCRNYRVDVSELLLHLEKAETAFPPNPALSHGKTWEWMGGPGSWAAYVLEIHTSCSFGRPPGHAESCAELGRLSAVLCWAMKQLKVFAYEHQS